MDENLQRLLRELGDAIIESVSGSESIAGAMKAIKDAGYDVFLVLEGTIGFNERSDEETEKTEVPPPNHTVRFKVSEQDLVEFFPPGSGIKLDDDEDK